MPFPRSENNGKFTYEDCRSWPEDKRRELIEGDPIDTGPAPSTAHQEIAGELFFSIKTFLKESGGPCRVFIAPFDVRLPVADEDDLRVDEERLWNWRLKYARKDHRHLFFRSKKTNAKKERIPPAKEMFCHGI